MRELFQKLNETLTMGKDAVLVTIVADSGSVPRGSGARMLVTDQGRIAGTIGGGNVEYLSIRAAEEALQKKQNSRKNFCLDQNDVADIGMICGGNVEVYFRCFYSADEGIRKLAGQAEELFLSRTPCILVTEVSKQPDGVFSILTEDGKVYGKEIPEELLHVKIKSPGLFTCGGRQFYLEKLVQKGCVYLFGGGHVAQQLAPLLTKCDFFCTVIEDREDFADPALFGPGVKTRCIPMEELHTLIPEITEDDYVCIMTRGHNNDYRVQYEMLKTPARYIGVIGSRKKIAGVRERLQKDGYKETDLDRITAPIGLEIGSDTPAEIAVSIAAQLILERSKTT